MCQYGRTSLQSHISERKCFAKARAPAYLIQAGHRRIQAAIDAGLKEIEVVVSEAANDNGAMHSMVENIAREPLLGSVSQLSCWDRTAVMVMGENYGAHQGRHTDVRVKRSRSEARTTLEAAATPQAF